MSFAWRSRTPQSRAALGVQCRGRRSTRRLWAEQLESRFALTSVATVVDSVDGESLVGATNGGDERPCRLRAAPEFAGRVSFIVTFGSRTV